MTSCQTHHNGNLLDEENIMMNGQSWLNIVWNVKFIINWNCRLQLIEHNVWIVQIETMFYSPLWNMQSSWAIGNRSHHSCGSDFVCDFHEGGRNNFVIETENSHYQIFSTKIFFQQNELTSKQELNHIACQTM